MDGAQNVVIRWSGCWLGEDALLANPLAGFL